MSASKENYERVEIDRNNHIRYNRRIILITGLAFFGVGIIIAWIYLALFGQRLLERQADEYECYIGKNHLRVKRGVYFKSDKRIPYPKITDFVWFQGPIMRQFGIEGIRVQTASSVNQMPEAVLLAISNASEVRDKLTEIALRQALPAIAVVS